MHTEQEIGIMASSGAASYSGHVNLGLWIDRGDSGTDFGSKAELRAEVPMCRRALAWICVHGRCRFRSPRAARLYSGRGNLPEAGWRRSYGARGGAVPGRPERAPVHYCVATFHGSA